MKINQISPQESDFTEVLSTIALTPKTLYYYGTLPGKVPFLKFPGGEEDTSKQMRPKTVAIVGARKNTGYGQEIAYKAAYDLAQAGVVIVSGLAYGIDSIAHRAALDAGGKTVAILGTPIERVYPAEHKGLALEISENGGAVMSEYNMESGGGHGEKGGLRFLYRNRLIAGLADAVLIVEASERSGSLNTANHALEQGKDVLAVPGNVDLANSEGCNNLIASGAMIYRNVGDIFEVLFPGFEARKQTQRQIAASFKGSPAEKSIIEQIAIGVSDGEEIMLRTGMDAAIYNRSISMLEIRGVVKPLGANRWMLR